MLYPCFVSYSWLKIVDNKTYVSSITIPGADPGGLPPEILEMLNPHLQIKK